MFSYNDYMQKKTRLQRNISFIPGPEGPPGAQGPVGPQGPQGETRYTILPPMSSINVYTMSSTSIDVTDTNITIQNDQCIPFTTQALNVGASQTAPGLNINVRSSYVFLIRDPGYYQVFYQVSITGLGKVVLTIDNDEYLPSKVGLDMGDNKGFLTCSTIIHLTQSALISLKNVSGDVLTLSAIDTDVLMTNLTITKIYP